MMHAPLVLALLLPQASSPAPPPRAQAGPPDVVGMALAAERRFFDLWEAAWARSEQGRRRSFYELSPEAYARVVSAGSGCSFALFRCGPDGPRFIKPEGINEPRVADRLCYFRYDTIPMYVPAQAWGREPSERKIASRENDRHWVCPNWLPPTDFYLSGPKVADERLGVDAALDSVYRRAMQRQRLTLIAQVASAVRALPANNLLTGQLVRLYADANILNSALNAARACKADAWWCSALLGYVHHQRGEIVDADRAFAQSLQLAPPEDRCRFANIGMLFGDARNAYGGTPCDARDSVHALVWTLADPLWSVPGNDRRTEQFARRVAIDLRAATGRDERYNWMPKGGGDALAEMVARYGWMTYASAGDPPLTVRFPPPQPPLYGTSQLFQPKPSGPPLPDPVEQARALRGAKTTFEYSMGRVHTVPSWRMVADPFSITNADWSLHAPHGETLAAMEWWPQEHYAPFRPLIGIPDQQVAFLRRDSTTLIAYATNLSQTDLGRRAGDSVRMELLVAPHAIEPVRLAGRVVGVLDRVAFLAALPSATPSIVSAEVPWDSTTRRGARSRFGARPPLSLRAIVPGELAISDPVLLTVPGSLNEMPLTADSALAFMHGSHTYAAGTRDIGVYWETYGFSPSDSVDVTVRVQRRGEGLLERIGVVTGITGDPNTPVSVSWKEPDRGRAAHDVAGGVPIQMRSVILNVAGLPAGSYALDISVVRPGGRAVTSRREFVKR